MLGRNCPDVNTLPPCPERETLCREALPIVAMKSQSWTDKDLYGVVEDERPDPTQLRKVESER